MIDLNAGEILWQVPLGELPELTAKGIPPTGTENYGGPIVTAGGVVFIAARSDSVVISSSCAAAWCMIFTASPCGSRPRSTSPGPCSTRPTTSTGSCSSTGSTASSASSRSRTVSSNCSIRAFPTSSPDLSLRGTNRHASPRSAALGVSTASTNKTLKVEAPAARSAGIKVKSVAELVEKLKNEAKVI